MLTLADIFVDQVYTLAPVLTWVTVALVELVFAAVARIAWHAVACVTGDAIYAGAVVAWVRPAVIAVAFTESAFESWTQEKGKCSSIVL